MNNFYKNLYIDNVTSFWERVKKLCKEKQVKFNELSERIGYNERTLIVKKSQKNLPPLEKVEQMAEILGVSKDYLINGIATEKEEKELEKGNRYFIPIMRQKLSAGQGQIVSDVTEIDGFMEIPQNLKPYRENMIIFYVEGDSMEPTLSRGDLVACDKLGYDGEGVYAIQRDGDVFVKRIEKDYKKWIIISDNPRYPIREEPIESENLMIMGRVRGVYKEL